MCSRLLLNEQKLVTEVSLYGSGEKVQQLTAPSAFAEDCEVFQIPASTWKLTTSSREPNALYWPLLALHAR